MHEFYHGVVVIVLMRCHDWPIETKEMDMTDYNSMKADEYAQRQGEMDYFYSEVERLSDELSSEIPSWAWSISAVACDRIVDAEAQRRVMQAIKERNEP